MEVILQFLRSMGTTKAVTLVATTIGLILLFAFIIFKVVEPPKVILYSNLEIEDSNKIISELESRNIDYKIAAGGTQILVPADRVLRLRMELAQSGLPGKGTLVGYEIFDEPDTLNSSTFVQNIHLLRALEGELSRTISTFVNIKKARVHLVVPRRELFSKEYQKPSASVVLEMRSTNTLSKDEVFAIGHFVSTAVPGLEMNNITIVDTRGKSLKTSDDGSATGITQAASVQQYKVSYETRLKRTIEELVEKIVGIGNVEAQVYADINFDRIVTNSEIYDLITWPSGS